MSYRTLCGLVKISSSCDAGIGRASKMTDKCAICVLWYVVVGKRTRLKLECIVKAIQTVKASYFDDFKHKELLPTLSEASCVCNADEYFIQDLLNYIEGMGTSPLEVALQAVEAVAVADLSGPDGALEQVREYCLHWQLRDALREAFENDLINPLPNVLYTLEDLKELTPAIFGV